MQRTEETMVYLLKVLKRRPSTSFYLKNELLLCISLTSRVDFSRVFPHHYFVCHYYLRNIHGAEE